MELTIALSSALWLGILTAISPCPLASNIAAISYIGQNIESPWKAVRVGIVYSIGRSIVYITLGYLVTKSLMEIPYLSYWLQKYFNQFVGPIVILIGMILLGLISFNLGGLKSGKAIEKMAGSGRYSAALVLGIVFALSFCPISAALFFGSLIPLAIKYESCFTLPFAYGLATALPVIFFGFIIALGANSLAGAFNKVTYFAKIAKSVTGAALILLGIYFTLSFTLKLI